MTDYANGSGVTIKVVAEDAHIRYAGESDFGIEFGKDFQLTAGDICLEAYNLFVTANKKSTFYVFEFFEYCKSNLRTGFSTLSMRFEYYE